MRILIVDDSEDSCDLTEAALASAGYTDICVAHSAWEAFKLMDIGWPSRKEAAQVDIILLDIVMPEVDGIEACARIRSDARYADIPIIMAAAADRTSVSKSDSRIRVRGLTISGCSSAGLCGQNSRSRCFAAFSR